MDKRKKLAGITSTIPVEVLYAAGFSVLDLNNAFITNKEPLKLVERGEIAGILRTECSWIKGMLGYVTLKEKKFDLGVVVPSGDCTANFYLADFFKKHGIKNIYYFNYPPFSDRTKERMVESISEFAEFVGVGLEEVVRKWEEFKTIRKKLKRIDELTWRDGKITGFENHLYLVSSTDMMQDPVYFSNVLDSFLKEAEKRNPLDFDVRLAFFGVPPVDAKIYDFVLENGANIVLNEVQKDFAMIGEFNDIFEQYLSYNYPYSIRSRVSQFKKDLKERQIDGIILYSQSFCHHRVEDDFVKEELKDFAVLRIELDKPFDFLESAKMRVETFVKALRNKKRGKHKKSEDEKIIKIGIDIGSRRVKVVIFRGRKLIDKFSFDTVAFFKNFIVVRNNTPELDFESFKAYIEKSRKIELKNFKITATGYGRKSVKLANTKIISEIHAHSYGAMFQTGFKDFLLLDMGGQDTKVVLVLNGSVNDFYLNDKCAAGGGRYIENMANFMGVSLDEMSQYSENPAKINTTCATFGETEVITRLMQGEPVESICAGINHSVVLRILPVLKRFKPMKYLVLSGGVSENRSVRFFLEKYLNNTVLKLDDSVYNGAIGCAVSDLFERE